jgi:hypothetical protein
MRGGKIVNKNFNYEVPNSYAKKYGTLGIFNTLTKMITLK